MREGSALLQGIVTGGHCGRRLHVHYRGRNSTPGYHCCGKDLVEGRGVLCLNIGGLVIEQAVAIAFLEAVTPAAVEAMRLTVEQLQINHDAALSQWRLEVERTRYEAERAERRYRPRIPRIDWLPAAWKRKWPLPKPSCAAAKSNGHSEQLSRLEMLGSDIRQVWDALTTTDRDRKELLLTWAFRAKRCCSGARSPAAPAP